MRLQYFVTNQWLVNLVIEVKKYSNVF